MLFALRAMLFLIHIFQLLYIGLKELKSPTRAGVVILKPCFLLKAQ